MDSKPTQFEINPNSGTPIYRQIVAQVHAMVAGGRLPVGRLLPSVRQVAKAADVNPMTVSKAYSRLEAEGVVERVRGQGMRVVQPNTSESLSKRKAQFRQFIEPALHRGHQLGLSASDMQKVIDALLKDQK